MWHANCLYPCHIFAELDMVTHRSYSALEADVSILMYMTINAVHPEQEKEFHCA